MSKAEGKITDPSQYTFGPWRRQALWKNPLLITAADGVYMVDASNKRYMDFSSQHPDTRNLTPETY